MIFRNVEFKGVLFQVSEDGEHVINLRTGNQMKLRNDKDGYRIFSTHHHGKKIHVRVHQLVAKAFLGERPEGYVLDHIDRNRANNHYSNLRYISLSEQNKNRDYTKINELNKAKAQLSRQACMKSVSLVNGDDIKMFESLVAMAEKVAEMRGCSVVTAKKYIYRHKERGQKVCGYEVIYND